MKKKLLSFIFAICLIIPAMFCLGGCNSKQDIELRVRDGYIQWSNDGDEWNDGISLNDLTNKKTDGNSKNIAYNLFKTTLLGDSSIDKNFSKYKLIYEYNDRIEEESYLRTMIVPSANVGVSNWNIWELNTRLRTISSKMEVDDTIIINPMLLEIIPCKNGSYTPKRGYSTYFNNNELLEIGYIYRNDIDINSDTFEFLEFLEAFKLDDVYDCEFNSNGDCKIAFNYIDQNLNEFIYEYCVTKDGKIVKCYIYEKDFLYNSRGNLYCKITYIENKSDVTGDMIDDSITYVVNSMISANPNVFDKDGDVFGYSLD